VLVLGAGMDCDRLGKLAIGMGDGAPAEAAGGCDLTLELIGLAPLPFCVCIDKVAENTSIKCHKTDRMFGLQRHCQHD